MSFITLGGVNAPGSGSFNLPAGTQLNGALLTNPTMSNPTITIGTITSGGTTTTSQTVNVLTSSLKPRLSTNGTTNTLRFQISTTPTTLGTQSIQFNLPNRTTAVSAVSDVSGPRPNAKDGNLNAVNDVVVGGVVAASGTPSGFVQFTANSTTVAHVIDITAEYIA